MNKRDRTGRDVVPDSRGSSSRERRLKRLNVLYKISNILTTTQRSETVLKMILREVVKLTHATSASLILIDREAGVLNIEIADNIDPVAARRLKLRIGEGVTGWVAARGKPLLVGDVRSSRHYVKIKADVRSELAVPLIIGDEVIGVINVDSNRRDAFTDGDLDMLTAMAAQSGKILQTSRLYEENRLKAERLAALFEVAAAIVSEPLLKDVLRRVADEVRKLVEAQVCSIMLLNEKGDELEINAVSGQVARGYIERKSIPVEGNIIGRVIQTRKPLYIPDVRKARGYRLAKVARESGLCSLLCVPMVFLDRPIGVLNIYSDSPRRFAPDVINLMTTLAGHSAVAIVNAKRSERIIRSEELLRESEKFQLLGMMSSEIAHEIRNPLSILTMLVHALRGDEGLTHESRTDLGVMDAKLRDMNRIVDQVLDFSRSHQIEMREVDVNQLVEDVFTLARFKASSIGCHVRKRLRETLPPVMGDPGQIEQAVLNLALNGLESMRRTGGALLLSTGIIKRKGGGQWVVIRVRDEGCGIPAEKIREIYAPYFSMSERGTGLGLFITQRIVTRHDGEMKVTSARGKGTKFEIRLPVQIQTEASKAAK